MKTGRQTTWKFCHECDQYRIFDWVIDEWLCRYCGKGELWQSQQECTAMDVDVLEHSNGKVTDGIAGHAGGGYDELEKEKNET